MTDLKKLLEDAFDAGCCRSFKYEKGQLHVKSCQDYVQEVLSSLEEGNLSLTEKVRDCNTCRFNGQQQFYPNSCTGCTPCGDTTLYRNWKPILKSEKIK